MPIYEYRCEDCGHELEKLQRMSDAPLTDCPACGKSALKRLVSAAGFRLKGGGWYETDFKQGNKRNLAGADTDGGGEKKAGSKTGEGGSKAETGDSKPASSKSSKTDTKSGGKNTASP
jgi:putative FmdB family regulatory protein